MPAEVLNSQIVFEHLWQNDPLAIDKYVKNRREKPREINFR